jgi:putative membrane protein
MARIFALTPAERELVTMAVTDAEKGTDGEIVTVVARRSDSYADAALHWAVLAMLLVIAVAAIAPALLETLAYPGADGWGAAPSPGRLLFTLLVAVIVAFLAVRYALEYRPLRMVLTPRATRARRVRRRALELFRVGAERRTRARVGVLLYLSLDERMAEIVADEAIHAKVPNERWGDAMAALIARVREGQPGEGMAAAVAQVGAIIAEHFPKTASDENELPDRLIEL